MADAILAQPDSRVKNAGRRARISLATIAGRLWLAWPGDDYRPTPSKNRIKIRVSGAPRSQSRI
jgi:hypothetical protein